MLWNIVVMIEFLQRNMNWFNVIKNRYFKTNGVYKIIESAYIIDGDIVCYLAR